MDKLKDEYGDRLVLLKVDIQSEAGKEIAREFNSSLTPTFVMFDGEGNELWRSIGKIDPDKVRKTILKIEANVNLLEE